MRVWRSMETVQKDGKGFNWFRWSLIILFLISIIIMAVGNKIPGLNSLDPIILNSIGSILVTFVMFIVVFLHGVERYGKKHMIIFFLITWAVSYSIETINVFTGFPAGYYYYSSSLGVLPVPLIIIFDYFAMGYLSWMLAHILTGQYSKKLVGKQIFIIPFLATIIMVMWDLTMDPISSTLQGLWVWQIPGPYFGIPLMNYVGWFLVVFIFFQVFALYISRYDVISEKITSVSVKPFWIEVPVIYGVMAFYNILLPLSVYNDLTISMALITVFTMVFVAILSLINVLNNPELK
jgi:putative membrane protein